MLMNRYTIAGSLIGGIKNNQECIDFCAKNNIYCDIELITIREIKEVYQILKSKSD